MRVPNCFESAEQFEAWLVAAKAAPVPRRPGSDEPNYCRDCTQRHKRQMMREGRCEYPETVFSDLAEPRAGGLPEGEERVGHDPTVRPEPLVAVRGSSPSSDRNPQEPIVTSVPIVEPSPALMGLIAAIEQQRKEMSALTGVAPDTAPSPSQS